MTHGGEVVARGAGALADRRGPRVRPPACSAGARRRARIPRSSPFEEDLRDGVPRRCSPRRTWQRSDGSSSSTTRVVQGQTVAGAGSDAAVVRVPGTLKGLALSTDGKGRFGALDPYLGAAHAVAEAARNVAVTGASPLAITNCMNFGNPERPAVMWQFAESIRGMSDACRALEHARHRRQRELLQRVGRLGDLAHAGDRDARPARGLPAARPHRVPARGARDLPAGGDVRRAGRLGVRRGGPGRGGRPPARAGPRARRRALHRLPVRGASQATCWRAPTTAATAGSRSRSRSRRSRAGTGSP